MTAITRISFNEFPKTRVEFINKWNNDHVFRNRAMCMGFRVAFGSVFFANGMIANKDVK